MGIDVANEFKKIENIKSDCGQCFGLCCVALPFAESADFAFNKEAGTPCKNLQHDFRCKIHRDLQAEGYSGCAAYDCFGAGQRVSQVIYKGNDWKGNPGIAGEMFSVFPIVQQLHEMLYYLHEALGLAETAFFHGELKKVIKETSMLASGEPEEILALDVQAHRDAVNPLLLKTSKLVRASLPARKTTALPVKKTFKSRFDFLGANLRNADLRGYDLRGALLLGADLRGADLRKADFIGADLRGADLGGADLTGSIFLTKAQLNAAKGDLRTQIPESIYRPSHWQHGDNTAKGYKK